MPAKHIVEIILFLGTATADERNPHGYGAGEKHAVIVFLRQEKGSMPNWSKAAASLRKEGWSDVVLSEANPIRPEALGSVHAYTHASYKDALEHGFAMLVFSESASGHVRSTLET